MNRHLLTRCLVAGAGALTVFTTAVATPSTCHLELHGRTLVDRACSADLRSDGRTTFESTDGRGFLIAVSLFATKKDGAKGVLHVGDGRSRRLDDLGELRRDGYCWSNAAVKACVIPSSGT